MTTTSTDTMIFIASWLDPRPAAASPSPPDGARDDDDAAAPMSRRCDAMRCSGGGRSLPMIA